MKTLDRRLFWLLILGLALAHLLLLAALHLVPYWFDFASWRVSRFSRNLQGSLAGAQCALLAIYWAISPWRWIKRTALFTAGLGIFVLAHAAVYYPWTTMPGTPMQIFGRLVLNGVDVFVGDTLVYAVGLELLRPVWGVLSRSSPPIREDLTIFALLRLTAMAAIAAAVVSRSIGYFEEPVWYTLHWVIDIMLLASCTWLALASRHAWLGGLGCLAAYGGVYCMTPEEMANAYGQWYRLPFYLLQTFWILATHMIVRLNGFRLHRVPGAPPSSALDPQQREHLE